VEHHDDRRTGELANVLRERANPPVGAFDALLQDASSEKSFDERQARRWQHQMDEESATWEGTLLDLAESNAHGAFDTANGDRIVGHICGVGDDVIVVRRNAAADLWLRRDTVVSASVADRPGTARGSRRATSATLQELLFRAAAGRPEVSFMTAGRTSTLSGTLLSCGTDVCVIRIDGDVRRTVAIPIAALTEVTVHG
jgi:hypothetical protein